jgi:hypothetical protein
MGRVVEHLISSKEVLMLELERELASELETIKDGSVELERGQGAGGNSFFCVEIHYFLEIHG